MADLKPPILLSLLLTLLFTPSSPFTPPDNHLLDCGSPISTAINNRKFVGDSSKFGLPFRPQTPSLAIKDQSPSPHPFHLYQSARLFPKPADYTFKINKKGTQIIRLHFHPFHSPHFNLHNALFHVSVNGVLLLRNFNPKPFPLSTSPVKEYFIWVDDADEVVISFLPLNFAFVNAIEVFSAPDDLIADTAKYVSYEKIEDFNGLTQKALETVYRLNVGGVKVTPFNDTLWRTWVPDHGILKANVDSKVVRFTGPIKYQSGGLNREVGPDNVYNSARVMKTDMNMTWVFDVSSGYTYLVRMHFCDVASKALNELYFNVYLNGYLAYENLDLSSLTSHMLSSPYYADFVVDGRSNGRLSVTVGPSKLSKMFQVKALLNGLEVMKMSNCMNSLDGEMSVDLVWKSSQRGNVGVLTVSVVVMSLVVAGSIYMRRKSVVAKESVRWSPLPVYESGGR